MPTILADIDFMIFGIAVRNIQDIYRTTFRTVFSQF